MTDFKSAPLKDLLETWLAQRLDESSGDERQDVDRDRDTTAFLEFLSRADRCAQMLQEAWPAERTGDNSGHETEVQHDKPLADETLTEDRQFLRFDRFELMRLLGRGGMGDVYLAFDTAIRREVALKIPHPALLMQTKTRKRFLQEARAAGRLRHPNIVGVHESGQAGSICFIAMEYCAGPTLSEWLGKRKEPVPLRLAAKIVARLARAMQHAHERGILHRDLKPSNVLLDPISESEGVADGALDASFPFVVRVTDFGLAQVDSEDGKLTQEGSALGTAAYMAPELASGRRDLQGPGTDVHSLGAILYELLTGQAAFQKENVMATLAAVQAEIPTPPRRLRHDACGDLEAICTKSMEKDIQARYASAGDMAEDLERFLRGEAVLARPISLVGRYVRWAKRRPALAALTLTAILAVVGAFVGMVWHDHRLGKALATAEGMRTRAEQAEAKALQQQYRLTLELYATDMKMAHDAWRAGDLRHAFEQLSRYGRAGSAYGLGDRSREANPSPSHWAATGATFDPRGWEWFYLWQRVSGEQIERVTQKGAGYYVCYSPDGKQIATAGEDGIVRIYESGLLVEQQRLDCGQGEVNGIQYTSDGRCLATAGDDGTLRVWNLQSRAETLRIQANPRMVFGVRFTSDDNQLIACGKDPIIRVFSVETGQLVRTLEGHTDAVEAIAMAPDGRTLASASSDETVKLWDLETGTLVRTFQGLRGRVSSVDFSPSGRLLAAGDVEGALGVWTSEEGSLLFSGTHMDGIQCLAFSDDDQWLTAGTRSGTLHHWNVTERISRDEASAGSSAPPALSWQAHDDRVYSIAYSPRGDRVASLGKDGVLKLWKPRLGESGLQCSVFSDHPVHDAVMLPGGNKLLTISSEALEILNCRTGKFSVVAQVSATDLHHLAVSPISGRVAAGGPYGQLYVGDLAHGFKAESWNLNTDWGVWGLAFTPDGTRLLANVGREEIRLFDSLTGTDEGVFAVEDCYVFVLSPDGHWLAAGSLNDIAVWDLEGNSPPRRLRGHTSTIRALAFSPDGSLLASSGNDRRVKIWSWADASHRLAIEGSPAVVETLCFSPDGKTLLTSGSQVPLTAWQVATGRKYFPVAEPLVHVFCGPDSGQVTGRTRKGHVWTCLLDGEGRETGP